MAARSRSRRRKNKSVITSSDYIYDFSCFPCSEEGKNTEALFQCFNCKQFFCSKCLAFHDRNELGHTVLKANDIYRRQEKRDIQSASEDANKRYLSKKKEVEEKQTCKYHEGEPITLYCFCHGEVCCRNCISDDHRAMSQ